MGEACRARRGFLSFLQSLIRSHMCVLGHSRCDQLSPWVRGVPWVRGLPSMHLRKTCRRHRATRGAAANAAVACRRWSVSTHFNATCRPTRPSVEASMKPDPIANMCVSLRSARSVLVALPPRKAFAAGRGAPPPLDMAWVRQQCRGCHETSATASLSAR